MELTPSQQATVKADILAQGDLNVHANTPDGNSAIADLYNVVGTVMVWRTRVPVREIKGAVVMNDYVALSASKQRGFLLLLSSEDTLDASLSGVRDGFLEIFGGGGTLTALTTVAKRTATRLEALLATGSGTLDLTVEGPVTNGDIMDARNS